MGWPLVTGPAYEKLTDTLVKPLTSGMSTLPGAVETVLKVRVSLRVRPSVLPASYSNVYLVPGLRPVTR
eukprot:scaffold3265_cov63-Phaeocystis_antarctica.AAC.4